MKVKPHSVVYCAFCHLTLLLAVFAWAFSKRLVVIVDQTQTRESSEINNVVSHAQFSSPKPICV